MSNDYPPVSFPPSIYPHGQNREVFANYGNIGHVCCGSSGEVICQNQKPGGNIGFTAVHPVLPLSHRPEKVNYPWPDRVMGEILNTNKKIKKFYRHTRLRQNWCKKAEALRENYLTIESAAKEWKEDPHKQADDFINCLDKGLRQHLTNYMELCDVDYVRYNNSLYAGGCLAHLEGESGDGYLVSPQGKKFDTLKLRSITEDADGLLNCRTVSTYPLSQPVHEINCDRVHGQGLMAVRGETSCHLFRVEPDTSDNIIQELHHIEKPGQRFTSVNISPYIPSEFLMTTEGTCHLWSDGRLKTVFGPSPPRFRVSDTWCSGHFGSHPRQVVYNHLCAVQLLDLRVRNSEALDLFTLPNNGLHKKERIRVCDRHKASPFYHVVGTDYSLIVMDERFARQPVLKWDHLLLTPPQYLSSLSHHGEDSTQGLIYSASQFPPDIHGFKFDVRQNFPPQRVSAPWRAAQVGDLFKWKDFIDDCSNPHLLRNRIDVSLAGFTAVQRGSGHAIFQLNCHGEIFHQVFKATSSDEDLNFSAGLGSHDLKPHPVATQRVKAWIASWEKHTRTQSKKQGDLLESDLSGIFRCMFSNRQPHKACAFCNPHPMTGSSEHTDTEDVEEYELCIVCNQSIKEGRPLVQSAKKDGATPSTSEASVAYLADIEDPDNLPSTSAMSRLLLKRWQKEEDLIEIQKDRDKEVLQHWKEWQERKEEYHKEPTILDRILGIDKSSKPAAVSAVSESNICSADFDSIASDKEDENVEPDVVGEGRVTDQEGVGRVLEESSRMSSSVLSDDDTHISSSACESVITDVESRSKHKKKKKKKHKNNVDNQDVDKEVSFSEALSIVQGTQSDSRQPSVDRDSIESYSLLTGRIIDRARDSDGSRSLFSSPEKTFTHPQGSALGQSRKRKRQYSTESDVSNLSYTPRMSMSNVLSFASQESKQSSNPLSPDTVKNKSGIPSSLRTENVLTQENSSQFSSRNAVTFSPTVLTQSPRHQQRHSAKKKTFTAGF